MPDATCRIEYDAASGKMVVRGLYGQGIEDSAECMAAAVDKMVEVKRVPRMIAAAEAREYEYSFDETRMLYEIAEAILKIRSSGLATLQNILIHPACDAILPGKYGWLQRVLQQLRADPVAAYEAIVHEARHYKVKLERLREGKFIPELNAGLDPRLCIECFENYVAGALEPIKQILEGTQIVGLGRATKLRDRDFYRRIFHPINRPTFMYTRFAATPPAGAEPLERYAVGDTEVEIFRVPGSTRKLYFMRPPEFRLRDEEYIILDQARRYLGRHEPTTEEIAEPKRFRENIFNISLDLIRDVVTGMRLTMPERQLRSLADILTRYTAGLGTLEIFLADERLQDILVNSPLGSSPVFAMHADYLECDTNIFPSQEDGESWATRFRLQSGRPLDEANPVLDTELTVPGGRARVAAITRPLAPDGLAFAFRRFRDKPWTFPLFIRAKMINSLAAGLMWFIIDGSRTALIAGTRGSGKTSFLGSLMTQIMPKVRTITVEDSVTGDCKLLLRKGGRVWKEEIGKLVDSIIARDGCRYGDGGHEISQNFDFIEVCALRNGSIEWVPVKSLIRHKVAKDILSIRTRTGREIKVTADHSLFGLDENCRMVPIKAGDLVKGSYLAVPRRLPGSENRIPSINLLVHLGKLKGFYLKGAPLRDLIAENWEEIKAEAKRLGLSKQTPRDWKNKGFLPCEFAEKFIDGDVPEGLIIAANRGGHSVPATLELDGDFLTFLGLWLGDGCYDKRSVIISATDDETRGVVKRIAQRLGMPVSLHSDGWSLMLASKVLHCVMKEILGLRGDAYTKSFPHWLWSLSDRQLAYVLRGLYSSDGYTAAAEIGMSLTSRQLLWDAQTALLRLGIVGRLNRQSALDKTWSLRISTLGAINLFAAKVGFLQTRRQQWLADYGSKKSTHDCTDVIPLPRAAMEEVAKLLSLSRWDYVERGFLPGRRKVQAALSLLRTDGSAELVQRLNELAHGDVLWDEVAEIKKEFFEGYVYDLSVPECENFVCENIIAHNTLELPVTQLREMGYNVERLKSRSVITRVETEVPAEEALRTTLRLGDSALILGEVRSTEALALFEAMRIGALANVVAGTIHGESPAGVFDRVVNDLGVPRTSFKAMDIIVLANTLRSADLLKIYRRVTSITEVRKHWREDPDLEGGFVNLMEYSAKEDTLVPTKTLLTGESFILNEIANRVKDWKANWPAVWDNIALRSRVLHALVEAGAAKPDVMEAPFVRDGVSAFHSLSDQVREEVGALDSKLIFERFESWLKSKM